MHKIENISQHKKSQHWKCFTAQNIVQNWKYFTAQNIAHVWKYFIAWNTPKKIKMQCITRSVPTLCTGWVLSKYWVTLPHKVFYSTNHCIKYKLQNSSNTVCSVYILGWEQIGSNPTLKSISQNTKYKIAQKYKKNCAQAGIGANTG